MFDGCFSWNSCYTYVGEKKFIKSQPSGMPIWRGWALSTNQRIWDFCRLKEWALTIYHLDPHVRRPRMSVAWWHSESLGSPSLDLSVHFPLQYGGYVMVSAMGMNLLLIYLGCKEVETREVEGLLAKLLLALQNLSILTSLCVILIWCLILLYLVFSFY